MTRIALLLLTVGAFLYAVWLVLRGKPLPQASGTRGLKRRFLLATLLFAGLLSQVVGGQSASDPTGADPNAPSQVVAAEDLWVTIKTVWRTLDPNQAEVFRQHLETAVADGQVRQRVADILSLAFAQIAAQNASKPQDGSPPPSGSTTTTKKSLGSYPEFSIEYALRQIQSLRKARETGGIDEALSQSVHKSLAQEIEMMWLLGVTPKEWPALDALWDRYWSYSSPWPAVSPIDSAAVAAKIIVESEGVTVSSLTPLSRFYDIQRQVDSLFYTGPVFSDWKSNSLSPSIEDILREMDLISLRHYVTCYRSLPRVTERTAELQELQTVLLQKCVDANLIDEQIATWAADPNGADPNAVDSHSVALPVDFALEAEVRTYQKKIRCVVVNLYDRGEVPSSFVRDVELAADIEIMPVDPNEARRRDMGYFLHALLDCPSKEPFAKALEDRGLIPPAQNHRMVTYNYNESCEADPNESHVLEFTALLDSGEDVTMKDDSRITWPASLLPPEDLEYRMTMRRVGRILTKLGYTDGLWLAPVEKAIGIPIVATIREEEVKQRTEPSAPPSLKPPRR